MRKVFDSLVALAKSALEKEPLVIIGGAAAVVIFVAGHFGVVLDKPTVESVLIPVAVALLGRPLVSPAKKGS